ncbi:hypothetical protein K450DRAFT_233511 [Umbelopsis ramanniana AG]|uniref:GPI ethanolamine phosphate transferase 1 n=1 Tax=Umbelopsis ramanniana AG TaxID=1314678 RepID=A0AAD5ED92_UMBRA|nr:uncharacterized protein K450DRAFT_233511 [Umbelopsis ramanniana AG]KAI8581187.1 hypothetical protein K450DRAFT_233511 [Umbelopsis ramanniana AG]
MRSRNALLLVGVVFHLVYLWSIFDIYFTSPLVHGMTPHAVELEPPADRLFLFVADGLRADKLYQLYDEENANVTKAPYLRDIIRKEGTWGVSHTRVPTESRPGHVAIIAGFYEDVSAVTTGWTMNPVNFDSVFNQSHHTWSFGSPDILPMFQHGASDPSKIETFMYPSDFEDFTAEASNLDTWVFDHVKDLFQNATADKELKSLLKAKKNVFFLHLLGLDTNGHAFGPHSDEYVNNVAHVDKGIKELVEIIEKFYGHDGKTSYVFTADHGMNNRGGHGDGHPDNTRTPIIAWGAGVQKPNTVHPTGHDDFSAEWDLNSYQRNDIKQADIAPLMASLVGINYPVNSIGELPLQYLDQTPLFKAQSLLVNAKQILAQYEVKHDEKQATELFFKPFGPLSKDHSPAVLLQTVEGLIQHEKYIEAENLCLQLIEMSLDGLRYFQTYDWLFLRSIITLGYIGWCLFGLEFVIRTYVFTNDNDKQPTVIDSFISYASIVALLGLFWIIYRQQMPPMYYAYAFFPVYFWRDVLLRRDILIKALQGGLQSSGGTVSVLLLVASILAGLETLVYSYFRREILSAALILAAIWPLFMPSSAKNEGSPLLLPLWSMSCLATSVFTLLPVEKGEDIRLVVLGGAIIVAVGAAWLYFGHKNNYMNASGYNLIAFELILIAASTVLVYSTSSSLQQRNGLPLLNQYASWAILIVSTILPFIYGGNAGDHFLHRIAVISLAFAPLMILLSISYEVLFYFCFCSTATLWLLVEGRIYQCDVTSNQKTVKSSSTTRSLQLRDVRTTLMFMFFVNVAFFGTGNVASLGSFSLQSVYRFVTIFNPALMGCLLIIKVLIPFFIISTVYGILAQILDLPSFSLFLLVVSINDVQTINFFYFVTDYGSWLEIGTSISHFCIAELFIIFTICLFWLGQVLLGKVNVRHTVNESLQSKKSQ